MSKLPNMYDSEVEIVHSLDAHCRLEEFAQCQDELEVQKLILLRQLAHDYRTPLTKILAAVETLGQHDTALDLNTQKRFLELIKDQILYLSQKTDRVLGPS